MKILIIEDEYYAAKRLSALVIEIIADAEILEVIDSVEESILWFKNNDEPDLVFLDIQLADGLSFTIFDEVKFICPVIFVTAFDEYAIDAFKLNSIDYLLKPIEQDKLDKAISKFKKFHHKMSIPDIDWSALGLSLYANKDKYKKRFLIKSGKSYQYIDVADIVLLYSEEGISFAINTENKRLIIDATLDKIEETIDPSRFFRISRKHIIAISQIDKIHPYLNSRLKIELKKAVSQDLIVSREKVKDFKKWIEG